MTSISRVVKTEAPSKKKKNIGGWVGRWDGHWHSLAASVIVGAMAYWGGVPAWSCHSDIKHWCFTEAGIWPETMQFAFWGQLELFLLTNGAAGFCIPKRFRKPEFWAFEGGIPVEQLNLQPEHQANPNAVSSVSRVVVGEVWIESMDTSIRTSGTKNFWARDL